MEKTAPLKILILNHNLVERGTYFRAFKFARYLASKGHKVTFITSSYRWYRTNIYRAGGVKVIESPSWSFIIGNDDGWSPLGILFRIKHVVLNKYDLVYGFSHKPVDFIPALIAKYLKRAFYITDWCDWWAKGGLFSMIEEYRRQNQSISGFRKFVLSMYDRIEAPLEEFVPKRADMVTVICNPLYERAKSVGIADERILHLVSGADTENVTPRNKLKSRKLIGLNALFQDNRVPGDAVFLGYTANYHMDEALLLETVSKVCNAKPHVYFLVVGPEFRCSDKKMREMNLKVFDAARGTHIESGENIIHFGRRPFREVPDFLGASDILVLPLSDNPYNRGRWPHKIGDYLAAGRPVAVNDVGDIPGLIKGKDVGVIAAPEPVDFADKIIGLIDEREKWDAMGENARTIAETDLDWDRLGEKLHRNIIEKFEKN